MCAIVIFIEDNVFEQKKHMPSMHFTKEKDPEDSWRWGDWTWRTGRWTQIIRMVFFHDQTVGVYPILLLCWIYFMELKSRSQGMSRHQLVFFSKIDLIIYFWLWLLWSHPRIHQGSGRDVEASRLRCHHQSLQFGTSARGVVEDGRLVNKNRGYFRCWIFLKDLIPTFYHKLPNQQ